MVAAGWGAEYLKVATHRKSKGYGISEDWDDGRKVLYCYDKMNAKNKEKIQAWLRKKVGCTHAEGNCKCGDPYSYMAMQPLRESVATDRRAEIFYADYTYEDKGVLRRLPPDTQRQYTLGASVLATMQAALDDKRNGIKERFHLSVEDYFSHMGEIIRGWQSEGKLSGKFSGTYQTLTRALKGYREEGYSYLISHAYANKSAAKVKDERSEAYLLELLDHPNQYDCVFVANVYNEWAAQNSYAQITDSTVKVIMNRNKQFLAGRFGKAEINDKTRRKIVHNRPSAPLLLWESDDNTLDWWFGGDKANEYNRVRGIFVTDSYAAGGRCNGDLILGYAYVKGFITEEVVKMAYLNAMYYVKELTCNWYAPFELKTDQWGIKSLRQYYENIARYYPTPMGSKGGRYDERVFGSADWQRSMKWNANNYTGHNISAKTRGVNLEATQANKKMWLHIDDAGKQLAAHVDRLRHMPAGFKAGEKSREQRWLEAFATMDERYKVPLTDEQFLMKFGIAHLWTNKIQNGMVQPTILGQRFDYEVPAAWYMDNIGRKVTVKYDPYDMSRVLVTDFEKISFVAKSVTRVAGCMADMQEGGRTFLNRLLATVTKEMSRAGEKKERRQKVLQEANEQAEDAILLYGQSLLKEDRQRLEEKALEEEAEWNELVLM